MRVLSAVLLPSVPKHQTLDERHTRGLHTKPFSKENTANPRRRTQLNIDTISQVNTSGNLYTHVRHLPGDDRVIVPPGEVQIAYWSTSRGSTKYLATGFMNAAWAIVIVSKEAGMLALLPAVSIDAGYPTPFGTANFSHDQNEELLNRLKKLFESNRGKFESPHVFVIAGAQEKGESVAEYSMPQIRGALQSLGLGFGLRLYPVSLPTQLPNTGYASIVVDATDNGTMPNVYLNDEVINSTQSIGKMMRHKAGWRIVHSKRSNSLISTQHLFVNFSWDLTKTQVFVVSGVANGEPVVPGDVKVIQNALEQLGLMPKWQGYKVLEGAQAATRAEGEVAVVVEFQREGDMPKVYVDDTPLN